MIYNEVFLIFIFGTLMIIVFAGFLILFVIQYKRRQQLHALEKQQMESNYQNQLLLSRLEVQEQSFKYFSEEIHDNIGQLLSIVKMQLYNIKSSSNEQDIITQATASTELLGTAITQLRNVSHTLNSTYVDSIGVEAAIRKDLDYICAARQLNCHIHKQGEEYNLGNERELLVFRIVQEAIANAIKHASPTAIDVYLDYTPEVFCVTVSDNGRGFDRDTVSDAGIGLSNMQVRAGLLNGELHVLSEKEKGTTVKLIINNAVDSQA